MDEIRMFGEIDLNKHGRPASDYPAWSQKNLIRNDREEIEAAEARLANIKRMQGVGIVDNEALYRMTTDVAEKKANLKKIEDSRPRLKGSQKDHLWKEREKLATQISDSMFTRSQMEMGTADANEEADRMSEPGDIQVSPELAKMCNLNQVDASGRCSRDQGVKAWKILSAALGEPMNAEVLRKDKRTR